MRGGLELEAKDREEKLLEHQFNILFFTDPLCCWSRGVLSHFQQLKSIFKGNITVKYCMCGMIFDWKIYSDPFQSIFKPAQMAPIWMQASEKINVVLDYMIWNEDPPSSSYPSCLAVTAARLQSEKMSEIMFHALNIAVTEKGVNIANVENIYEVAAKIAQDYPLQFELTQFKNDLAGKKSRMEFRNDLKLAQQYNVQRFPTIHITNAKSTEHTVRIGYQPFEELMEEMNHLI